MLIEKIVNDLECIKCGAERNLTTWDLYRDYRYKNSYSDNRFQDKKFQAPVCYDCKELFEKYVYKSRSPNFKGDCLSCLLFIIFSILVIYSFYYVWFMRYLILGIFLMTFGTFFSISVLLEIIKWNDKDNPERFVKFKYKVPMVRLQKRYKWIPLDEWIDKYLLEKKEFYNSLKFRKRKEK